MYLCDFIKQGTRVTQIFHCSCVIFWIVGDAPEFFQSRVERRRGDRDDNSFVYLGACVVPCQG